MNQIKSEIFDSILRMFGLRYMEKEMGEKFKNDADFQNAMKEARQSEIRALKSYYESIKNDKEFRNDHVLEILREIFEPKNNEIENAKKLLERCGYKVMK